MKWIERDGKVAVTLPAKLAGSTEPIALQFDTPLPKQNKK
jgi:alpha-L-fucosidase